MSWLKRDTSSTDLWRGLYDLRRPSTSLHEPDDLQRVSTDLWLRPLLPSSTFSKSPRAPTTFSEFRLTSDDLQRVSTSPNKDPQSLVKPQRASPAPLMSRWAPFSPDENPGSPVKLRRAPSSLSFIVYFAPASSQIRRLTNLKCEFSSLFLLLKTARPLLIWFTSLNLKVINVNYDTINWFSLVNECSTAIYEALTFCWC